MLSAKVEDVVEAVAEVVEAEEEEVVTVEDLEVDEGVLEEGVEVAMEEEVVEEIGVEVE